MNKKIKITLSFLFKNSIQYKPSFLMVYLLDIVVKVILPFVNIFFPKYLIAELLGTRQMKMIILYVACIVVGNTCIGFLSVYLQERLNKNYYEDFGRYFDAMLSKQDMMIPYHYTEDKDIRTKSQRARDGLGIQSGGVGGIATCVSSIIINALLLLGTCGVLIANTPLIFLIVVGIVIIYYSNKKINAIQFKYFEEISENNRNYQYTLFNLSHIKYGKDIRLYQAQDVMLRQADYYNQNMAQIGRVQAKEKLVWLEIGRWVMALRESGTFLYLGYLGIKGIIAIADFMMLVNASNTFGNSLNAIISQIQDLSKKIQFAYDYVDFLQMEWEKKDGTKIPNNDKIHSIEFKHVTFAYPGNDKKVLDDVSVTINAGEKISIVGFNGAGKSTFIKVLCRLYTINEGEILVDGININDFSLEEYYKLISVVFQDFVVLAFSVKDNILLGDSENTSDGDIMPLIEQVGLEKKINALPMGINTPVYKWYDVRGFEPSGGEQQKMVMARAIYKAGSIVILDEPTAALDPIAEAEIYEQFNDMVDNKTALFISHRLSSCKFCDRILVFENGKIIENGTHKELLEYQNGVYAMMYQTQAQYYQK